MKIYYMILDDGIFGVVESFLIKTPWGIIEDCDTGVYLDYKNIKNLKKDIKYFEDDCLIEYIGEL